MIQQPYILEHFENIKLSRSQYIATSIISYGPYRDMFVLENVIHTFHRQLITIINSKPLTEINTDMLMPKYNQFLVPRYSDTVFLIT